MTVNLLINYKNSVIYSKVAVNYDELCLWNRPTTQLNECYGGILLTMMSKDLGSLIL